MKRYWIIDNYSQASHGKWKKGWLMGFYLPLSSRWKTKPLQVYDSQTALPAYSLTSGFQSGAQKWSRQKSPYVQSLEPCGDHALWAVDSRHRSERILRGKTGVFRSQAKNGNKKNERLTMGRIVDGKRPSGGSDFLTMATWYSINQIISNRLMAWGAPKSRNGLFISVASIVP